MDKTSCYSYFAICSEGEIQYGLGLVAAENGNFDPEEISKMLGILPFRAWAAGTPRGKGNGVFRFSMWSACRQDEPALDAGEQCLKIVRELTPLIPELNRIREQYNVSFSILIVPKIYNEETPTLVFDSEIIEFCHLTKTEIGIDLYVYDRE